MSDDDEEIQIDNPFHPDEDNQSDISNDNNNKQVNSGNENINFSINSKEIKDILKEIEEENAKGKEQLDIIFQNINDQLLGIKEIYKENKNYKEKEKEVESILNLNNDIHNKFEEMMAKIKGLNKHKINLNNNQ